MKKVIYILFIVSLFFICPIIVQAKEKLFTCDYNVLYAKDGKTDKTFPLSVDVYDDKTVKYRNYSYETQNAYLPQIYVSKGVSVGVSISFAERKFYESAVKDGKYRCPSLMLQTTNFASYDVYLDEADNTTQVGLYRYTTVGKEPKVHKAENNDKVIKLNKECTIYKYEKGKIDNLNFNFENKLKMYSDGSKEACISSPEFSEACQKINNSGDTVVVFRYGENTYNLRIAKKQIPTLFPQTDKQKKDNTFSCPTVYFYSKKGSPNEFYFTTDKQEAMENTTGDEMADPEIGDSPNLGQEVEGCAVIPEVIRKWINNILKIIRYVALALVIALGALDFMKAAASGEPDAMKKAGQSFMKRMIAVVILFLLPVIVDFILNMINIYGVDKNNIDCMKPTN